MRWQETNTLISANESGTLVGHDVRSGEVCWSYETPSATGRVCALGSLTKDGDEMVLGHDTGHVSIFSVRKTGLVMSSKVHEDEVRGLAVNGGGGRREGTTIVSTCSDGTCAVSLRAEGGGEASALRCVARLKGHDNKGLCVTLVSAVDDTFISSAADGRVLLWSPPWRSN